MAGRAVKDWDLDLDWVSPSICALTHLLKEDKSLLVGY